MTREIIFKLSGFVLIILTITGCSVRKLSYQATGATMLGGAGYLFERNPIHAAVGGTAGALVGSWLYDNESKREKNQYDKGYNTGYKEAQLKLALDNWENNTGQQYPQPQLAINNYQRIKIPKQELNGVIYEEHYETIEVLR